MKLKRALTRGIRTLSRLAAELRRGARARGAPSPEHAGRLRDLDIMSRTVWGEARSEDFAGMLAVAQVIRNRTRTKWARGTLADVCLAPAQFSCWNANDLNRPLLDTVTLDDDAYLVAYGICCLVVAGEWDDPTGRATHYHNKNMSPYPNWASSPQMVRTVEIGRHVFYREHR